MVRLVVKATLSGSSYPRRTTFPDATSLERQDLALKLARSFSLQPDSFRLAYRDDDNDLIELSTDSDLQEAIDYFSTDAGSSSSSTASSSGWFGVGPLGGVGAKRTDAADSITLKLEILVEYDGPSLSDAGSSVYSLGSRSRSSSSSAGSDAESGWASSAAPSSTRRRMRAPSISTVSDGDSDRWILRTAYSRSRNPDAHGGGEPYPATGVDFEGSDDEEDWDRRTLSSASHAFGPSRGAGEGPTARHRIRDQLPDSQRIPPPTDGSRPDALYPNFARGLFHEGNPHPYLYPGPGAAPAYAHLHHHPYPFPPPHAFAPPRHPHSSSPSPYSPPRRPLHCGAMGHPGLGMFPPPPFAHLAHPPFDPAMHFRHAPPPPGFFPGHRYGDSLPPFSFDGGSSAASFGPGRGLGSGLGPSPTPSQRDRARDLFADSSSDGGAVRPGQAQRTTEAAMDDAESSYTVTSSDPDVAQPLTSPSATAERGEAKQDGDPDADEHASVPARESSTAPTSLSVGTSRGVLHCVRCKKEICGPRYSCAVCEAYDLCQECERLPVPIDSDPAAAAGESQWTASTQHDESHILLKIPVSVTSSAFSTTRSRSATLESVARAVSRATSLASASDAGAASQRSLQATGEDVAEYWKWWSSWYSSLPYVHPPPPPSTWYASIGPSGEPPLAPGQDSRSTYAPLPNPPGPSTSGASLAAPATGPPPPPLDPLVPVPPAAPPAAPPPPPMYARAPPPTIHAYPSYGLYEYANHGVSCRHCGRTIPGPSSSGVLPTVDGKERGVRWLCANCPTIPSYDLCPDCEPLSHKVHDPTHAFLRITHPLRRPLPSVRALLPVLYLAPQRQELRTRDLMDLRSEAGSLTSVDSGGSGSSSGGSAKTRRGQQWSAPDGSPLVAAEEESDNSDAMVVHDRVMCDSCGQRVRGTWMACCHCPGSFDLCVPCLLAGASARQGHNPSHIFIALKRLVDFDLHDRMTRLKTRRPRGLLEVDLYL